jgi:hypothetical protein
MVGRGLKVNLVCVGSFGMTVSSNKIQYNFAV